MRATFVVIRIHGCIVEDIVDAVGGKWPYVGISCALSTFYKSILLVTAHLAVGIRELGIIHIPHENNPVGRFSHMLGHQRHLLGAFFKSCL